MADLTHLQPPGVTINGYIEDEYETRLNAALRPWDRDSTPDAGLLGVPYDGASVVRSGSREAPDAVRQAFYYNTTYSPDFDVDIADIEIADLGDVDVDLMDIATTHARTEDVMTALFDRGVTPVVVGGDHSISYATVAAACERPDIENLGLIQFDAHQDLRHSHGGQPSSGVQFRQLLEERPEFDGEHYAQVGIRGFMNSKPYMEYADDQGITVFSGRDVARQGMETVVSEALEIATTGTDGFFATVDIDCLDLSIAPGTAAPSPGGLSAWDILEGVYAVGSHPKSLGMDLVEIAPPHDVNGLTSITGATILLHYLGGLSTRR
ncbi:agmatinase family protein [Natrononativus amylolyticus]|uniref:agmatinase family protein n=1 Tax=Natrononativus amylolyticus TaxID=2963434 RepID=UPI0020CFBC91|nr:agmatinase family protein [Natrononativus amylolyticus]